MIKSKQNRIPWKNSNAFKPSYKHCGILIGLILAGEWEEDLTHCCKALWLAWWGFEGPDCEEIKQSSPLIVTHDHWSAPGPVTYCLAKLARSQCCLWSDRCLPAQPIIQPCFTHITSIPVTKIGRTAQYPQLCLLPTSGLLFKLGLKRTMLSSACTPLPVPVPSSRMLPHFSTPLTLSL